MVTCVLTSHTWPCSGCGRFRVKARMRSEGRSADRRCKPSRFFFLPKSRRMMKLNVTVDLIKSSLCQTCLHRTRRSLHVRSLTAPCWTKTVPQTDEWTSLTTPVGHIPPRFEQTHPGDGDPELRNLVSGTQSYPWSQPQTGSASKKKKKV